MIPCFLIPITVGLISAILGYLLGKMMAEGNSLNLASKLETSESENEQLNNKLYLLQKELAATKTEFQSSDLQTELDECRKLTAKLEEEIEMLNAKTKTVHGFTSVTVIPFDAELASSVFGKEITKDDLKIIEGVGPKIEELYHAAGVTTWKDLAETSVEILQNILDEAGSGYAMHNPETWSRQALLAYQGKWQELKDYQESLNAGRE